MWFDSLYLSFIILCRIKSKIRRVFDLHQYDEFKFPTMLMTYCLQWWSLCSRFFFCWLSLSLLKLSPCCLALLFCWAGHAMNWLSHWFAWRFFCCSANDMHVFIWKSIQSPNICMLSTIYTYAKWNENHRQLVDDKRRLKPTLLAHLGYFQSACNKQTFQVHQVKQ